MSCRHSTRSTNQPGLGLGLFIAKAVLQRHGGTVEVLPGPGGRITATLPARQ